MASGGRPWRSKSGLAPLAPVVAVVLGMDTDAAVCDPSGAAAASESVRSEMGRKRIRYLQNIQTKGR